MSIVVLLLAFFGISLEESTVANQEIVVQFHECEVSNGATENAIALVKEQLQTVGAKNVQVVVSAGGELVKITYYSEVDIAAVEQKLSEKSKLQLGSGTTSHNKLPFQFPSHVDFSGYQLNISEIQTGSDAPMNLNGTLLEFTSASDLYFHPAVYFGFNDEALQLKNNQEHVFYKYYNYNALFISEARYHIPESRAGPLA